MACKSDMMLFQRHVTMQQELKLNPTGPWMNFSILTSCYEGLQDHLIQGAALFLYQGLGGIGST